MIQTYISILRGINVSGQRMIKMEALRKVLSDSGFQNVVSFIQSGNIVFRMNKSSLKDLEKRISGLIMDQFHFDVPVIVLEIEELKIILQNNPFLKDASRDVSYMHITFLSEEPLPAKIEAIKKDAYQNDEFYINGKAIYLYCPNGYGRTKLTNTFFETN